VDNDDEYLTTLIPVSEWVWNLYKVEFRDRFGQALKIAYLVGSCEGHITADCNDAAPSDCEEYSWAVVKENVPAPRTVGRIHSMPLSESGWVAGRRMKEQL
jgi:hypothetical protein